MELKVQAGMCQKLQQIWGLFETTVAFFDTSYSWGKDLREVPGVPNAPSYSHVLGQVFSSSH